MVKKEWIWWVLCLQIYLKQSLSNSSKMLKTHLKEKLIKRSQQKIYYNLEHFKMVSQLFQMEFDKPWLQETGANPTQIQKQGWPKC